MEVSRTPRRFLVALLAFAVAGLGAAGALVGTCGPFTDTAADAFCPFVLEIFYLAVTTGTTATTYSPGENVTRLQMAAFLSRTVDGALKRRGKRAALPSVLDDAELDGPRVDDRGPEPGDRQVRRGGPLDRRNSRPCRGCGRTMGGSSRRGRGRQRFGGVAVAIGRVIVTGGGSPGSLYSIDPGQAAGAVTTVASNLGNIPLGIAFDGTRFFTSNQSGSVSLVTPGATIPWTVTTVAPGSISWKARSSTGETCG